MGRLECPEEALHVRKVLRAPPIDKRGADALASPSASLADGDQPETRRQIFMGNRSELTQESREKAEEVLEYRFNNPRWLAEALTHASVADDRRHSNERLEFLGDAILGAVICEHLFHAYPDWLEGELTKTKSTVVSRQVCAEIAAHLGLPDLMTLGKGMTGRPGLPSSLGAAVFESVVAGIYLDGGLEEARRFVLRHMEPYIHEAASSAHQKDFKSLLQQYAQKNLPDLPTYVLLEEHGPDHAKEFKVCVEVAGQRYRAVWGSSKKQAEQQAALATMEALGLVEMDDAGRVQLLAHDIE